MREDDDRKERMRRRGEGPGAQHVAHKGCNTFVGFCFFLEGYEIIGLVLL